MLAVGKLCSTGAPSVPLEVPASDGSTSAGHAGAGGSFYKHGCPESPESEIDIIFRELDLRLRFLWACRFEMELPLNLESCKQQSQRIFLTAVGEVQGTREAFSPDHDLARYFGF